MLVCKLTNVFHFSFSKLKRADISLRVFDLKQKRFICIRRNLLEKLYFWNLEKWFQTISWLHKLCKNKTHPPGLSITLRRFFFILYRSTRIEWPNLRNVHIFMIKGLIDRYCPVFLSYSLRTEHHWPCTWTLLATISLLTLTVMDMGKCLVIHWQGPWPGL